MEIPSRTLSDRWETLSVPPFHLRVIAKEVVIADRIVGFKYWGVTDYGLQAIKLLSTLGPELQETLLLSHLDRENARDAYDLLRRLADSEEPITHERLQAELQLLAKRR